MTQTLCVQTRRDPTSVAVYEVLKEMAETVSVNFQLWYGFSFCSLIVTLQAKLPTVNILQIWMNAQVLKETAVTRMQCVLTLRGLTFVVVYEALLETENLAVVSSHEIINSNNQMTISLSLKPSFP